MRFLIYPNRTYEDAVLFAERITAHLLALGHECYEPDGEDDPRLDGTDMGVIVGGDGTVLRAVRMLFNRRFPFWAINYGHLGYLTECEPDEAFDALDRILMGDYRIEKRARLNGYLEHEGERRSFDARNEAVIHRSGYMRTLKMTLSIGGTGIMEFAGDGLLVSTPTGSTAYNLSAGGPILLPDSQQLVITPICPHSALCAPLVVTGDKEISVGIQLGSGVLDGDCPQLLIDGCECLTIMPGARIVCRIAPSTTDFVKTNEMSFYRRLRSKMAHRG